MKTAACTAILAACIAIPAFAVVDPCPNDMGIYFDLNADVYEHSSAPYTVVPTYVILTHPDFDAIHGYEFGYDMVGGAMISEVGLAGSDPTDSNEGDTDFNVLLSSPLPTDQATVLTTLSVFLFDYNPVAFTLRGADPNSISGAFLPLVRLPGDELRLTGLAVWDWDLNEPGICARINGPGGVLLAPHKDCLLDVATDEMTWDAVKSMYR